MTGAPIEPLVQLLLSQAGGRYLFGGKVASSIADPKATNLGMDCSGFIAWGTGRLGHPLDGGSGQQLAACAAAGLTVPVPEAIATRGALLFIPANGSEHVACSLGDGHTIEAHDTADGIGTWPAAGRFFAAALIPGFDYTPTQGDDDMASTLLERRSSDGAWFSIPDDLSHKEHITDPATLVRLQADKTHYRTDGLSDAQINAIPDAT